MYQKDDYGLDAEWHFFATSHGKSPCDGIGGTVKRLATRASLQATVSDHILTAEDLFNFAFKNITGIRFIYVSSDQIDRDEQKIKDRLDEARTVAGTRSHHAFIPYEGKLKIYRISQDSVNNENCTISSVSTDLLRFVHCDPQLLQPGKYVAAMYDGMWYAGLIMEHSTEHSDVTLNFMTRNSTTNNLTWPRRKDICCVPYEHVLCILNSVGVCGRSARTYQISEEELKSVTELKDKFLELNSL